MTADYPERWIRISLFVIRFLSCSTVEYFFFGTLRGRTEGLRAKVKSSALEPKVYKGIYAGVFSHMTCRFSLLPHAFSLVSVVQIRNT
ncbi:unnamed protein product [Auanema sp. JU1783]|nr:unnamed protein product [Auanema sp. JU1783]